jgi:glycosyltransferase involved in cell wall biosynthesis
MVPFDSKSRIERKLPHLSIAATIIACLEAEVEHNIILKTHDAKPEDINTIVSKAIRVVEQHAPSWNKKFNIELHDKWMGETELSILSSSCHAVISLNRGEGFGLSGVEAMASGIPIVWTNWGGSTQYMNLMNCYPVDPIAIIDVAGDDYFKTGQWAEPSLVSAVDQIKDLISNIKSGWVDRVIEAGYVKAEEFNATHVRGLMQQSIERILC